ncbi:MAG: peptidylprolyl isomerase [Solirubrobacterales bacterium]
MRRRVTVTAAGVAAAMLIAACGGDGGDDEGAQLPAGCEEVQTPEPKRVELAAPKKRLQGPATAVVATSCGDFEIELDTARAPVSSSSFAHLAREGVYDGTPIHRIEPGFVVQGGDPSGDGTGGPGYFVDELPPQNLSYTRGTVAMAKTAAEPPGRSGSQFFVVTAADAGLSPDYALLGRVSSGFDVVERIEELGGPDGKPSAPVVIETVTVEGG